jgi:hypothetical protein
MYLVSSLVRTYADAEIILPSNVHEEPLRLFPTPNPVVDRTAFWSHKATQKVTVMLTGSQLTDGRHNVTYTTYQPSVQSAVRLCLPLHCSCLMIMIQCSRVETHTGRSHVEHRKPTLPGVHSIQFQQLSHDLNIRLCVSPPSCCNPTGMQDLSVGAVAPFKLPYMTATDTVDLDHTGPTAGFILVFAVQVNTVCSVKYVRVFHNFNPLSQRCHFCVHFLQMGCGLVH